MINSKFIDFGLSIFKTSEVDYVVLKDSDLPKEYEGYKFFVSMKSGPVAEVEYTVKCSINSMNKKLLEYNFVTIKDKTAGDIYSINVDNILYIERDVKNLLRIHFEKDILCIPIKDDEEAYSIIYGVILK